MKNIIIAASFVLVSCSQLFSQILTKEDSLNAGLIKSNNATVVSGYGNVKYSNNITLGEANSNVDRLVLFVGHKFKKNLSFFSELEVEDAKVEGGSVGGEFAIEQAFIKFDINRNNYFSAGLILPRIGITNENHLPTTFNGNNRPYVEGQVIPATWREIGVGYYGYSNKIPGLNYSAAILNGLNCEEFESEEGIREGRYEGRNANSNNLSLTGAILYYKGGVRTQISAYVGGSNTMSQIQSDSLGMNRGIFGCPVELLEYDLQYKHKGFQLKGLVSYVNISDASKLNSYYGKDVAQSILGYYGEVGYNLTWKKEKAHILFVRYENIDMTNRVTSNALYNPALNYQIVTAGLSILPHNGVIVKFDYSYRVTGTLDESLVDPLNAYNPVQQSFTIGLGYSF